MSSFDKLMKIYKTHEAIAQAFKVERQAITRWKRFGIPAKRAIEVERKTKGVISAMDVLRG